MLARDTSRFRSIVSVPVCRSRNAALKKTPTDEKTPRRGASWALAVGKPLRRGFDGELPSFGLDEACIGSLDLHLPQDRGVQRGGGGQAVGAGPESLLGHRLDQFGAVH